MPDHDGRQQLDERQRYRQHHRVLGAVVMLGVIAMSGAASAYLLGKGSGAVTSDCTTTFTPSSGDATTTLSPSSGDATTTFTCG
jgi:hypothetical protein